MRICDGPAYSRLIYSTPKQNTHTHAGDQGGPAAAPQGRRAADGLAAARVLGLRADERRQVQLPAQRQGKPKLLETMHMTAPPGTDHSHSSTHIHNHNTNTPKHQIGPLQVPDLARLWRRGAHLPAGPHQGAPLGAQYVLVVVEWMCAGKKQPTDWLTTQTTKTTTFNRPALPPAAQRQGGAGPGRRGGVLAMGTLHLRCVLRAARFREHRHPSICRLHHLTHTPSHNRNAGHEITAELPPMKSYALKARVHAGDGALALELDLARELQVRFWLAPPPPRRLFVPSLSDPPDARDDSTTPSP